MRRGSPEQFAGVFFFSVLSLRILSQVMPAGFFSLVEEKTEESVWIHWRALRPEMRCALVFVCVSPQSSHFSLSNLSSGSIVENEDRSHISFCFTAHQRLGKLPRPTLTLISQSFCRRLAFAHSLFRRSLFCHSFCMPFLYYFFKSQKESKQLVLKASHFTLLVENTLFYL